MQLGRVGTRVRQESLRTEGAKYKAVLTLRVICTWVGVFRKFLACLTLVPALQSTTVPS